MNLICGQNKTQNLQKSLAWEILYKKIWWWKIQHEYRNILKKKNVGIDGRLLWKYLMAYFMTKYFKLSFIRLNLLTYKNSEISEKFRHNSFWNFVILSEMLSIILTSAWYKYYQLVKIWRTSLLPKQEQYCFVFQVLIGFLSWSYEWNISSAIPGQINFS